MDLGVPTLINGISHPRPERDLRKAVIPTGARWTQSVIPTGAQRSGGIRCLCGSALMPRVPILS
jgi:hypothetical protein